MRLEVVDGDERHVPRQRQRLGGATRRRAARPPARARRWRRPRRPRSRRRRRAGPTARPRRTPAATTGMMQVDVGAAGDLGHHAAVAGVQVDLAAHDRRQHRRAAVDDGGGRLVARRLDAEDRVHRRSSVERLEDGGAGHARRPRSVEAVARTPACRRRWPTSRWRLPWSRRSSPCGSRPARTRRRGRAPGRRRLLVRTSSVRFLAPALDRGGGERVQEPGAELVAVPRRVDGEGGDVAVVGHEHEPAVADDASSRPGRRRRPASRGCRARS